MIYLRSSGLVRSLGIRTVADGVANDYGESQTAFRFGGIHEISVEIRNADEADVSQGSRPDLYLLCQATGKWEPSSSELLDAFEVLREGRVPGRNESLEELERELDEAIKAGERSGYSFPWDVLPSFLQHFIDLATSELHRAIRRSVDALRWRSGILGYPAPYSSRRSEWSLDGEQWHPLPGALRAYVEAGSTRTVHLTDEARSDVEALLSGEVEEPLGHVLFREAWALRKDSLRSALVIGVAALEAGFKKFVAELVPDAEWLVEEAPTPPLGAMLKNYLPQLPAKCTFESGVLPPPRSVRSSIDEAVKKRNKVVHAGTGDLDYETLKEWLLAIRDVLWILDFYRGFRWALTHVREETIEKMRS